MTNVISAGRVVVGTDTSEAARAAVDWAATRASEVGAPLLILIAVAPTRAVPASRLSGRRAHAGRAPDRR